MINKIQKVFSVKPLYTFLFFVLLIQCVSSQTRTYSSGNYTYESVDGDPFKARIYKLQNGLTVFMTVYKNEPRIQTYIAVRAGSKFDPSDATGLAHYLEHMLFKGTDNYGTKDYEMEKVYIDKIINLYEVYRTTTDENERKKIYHQIDSISGIASQYAIANEYDKMISSIGGKGTNAYTWVEQTVYTNDIPSNQLEKWLTLEAERFRLPVMRLFHTELEAVYEEKNIRLDDDGDREWEALFLGLFPTHQYGTQTTIGTVEHLKNPSIQKVINYYNTYYVPNNMAMSLSGDFDMDEAMKLIDEKFGKLQPKEIPEYIPPVESPISEPVIKEVYGPESEEMFLGFRFGGVHTPDIDMITLISRILYNRTAGLIDIDLNQSQKVLEASAFVMDFKDYSSFLLYGKPRNGQSLEEVRDLLLAEIEKLKKGDFPDWLPEAIINNIKFEETKSLESNRSRAHAFVDAFILGIPWQDYISQTERLSKITKNEIVKFANERFENNYVISYKRKGENKNVRKVEKPLITPVNVNREVQSKFLTDLVNKPAPDIEPVFADYKNDIKQTSLSNGTPVYYIENTENSTFNLYYVLDFGTNSDKKLGLAIGYLEYLGTAKYSPSELKQEFFKIGCSFSVSSSVDQVYVSIGGLSDNFDKGLELFEEFLSDIQPNKDALDNLVNDILKVREDNKLSQDVILWDAMFSYAKYGPKSPFTNRLTEDELKSITPEELVSILKKLRSYPHMVLYYGPLSVEALASALNTKHVIQGEQLPLPRQTEFEEKPTDENTVYFVNYKDMVQAEIVFLSKCGMYDKNKAPYISMFNEYFGSGMSGIVFQELRESRALAYAAFASYSTPQKKENSYYVFAYIGTQADKLKEAMNGTLEILNVMPESDITFNTAKNSLLNQIKTSRTTKASILFDFLAAKKRGLDYDIRKDIYGQVPSLTLNDVINFQEENVKNRNYAILILGDKNKVDMKALEKFGKVKELSLEEVFGY